MTLILVLLVLFGLGKTVEMVACHTAAAGCCDYNYSIPRGFRGYMPGLVFRSSATMDGLKLNYSFFLMVAVACTALYYMPDILGQKGVCLAMTLGIPSLAPFHVKPVKKGVSFEMGREFSVKFGPAGEGKNYLVPVSGLDATRKKLEVARTSYWYPLVKAGIAAPWRLAPECQGLEIHNKIHIYQKAQEYFEARGYVMVGDGKHFKGYIVRTGVNPVIDQMILDGVFAKENTRFNANHEGITFWHKEVRFKTVDWKKTFTKKFLGTLGDGASITPYAINIDEHVGNAFQWRVTDIFGNIAAGDNTDKGSLTVVPWKVWEHACNHVGADANKVTILASADCFKYPKRQHLEEHSIKAEQFRIVGIRRDTNQSKSALTMAGVVTAPIMWPIITRLLDWNSDVNDHKNIIRDCMHGDVKSIEQIFKRQVLELNEQSLNVASLLFKIPGDDGRATIPMIKSTMPKIWDRIRSFHLRKLRKVPFLTGGTRMITWYPAIEEHVVEGSGWFPMQFVGQSLCIAWDAVAKTYGDADGDDICYVQVADGIYIIWRNPVNGVNAFSVCIDIDSGANATDIPEWVRPLVEASKEFHYIPEPPKSKAPKAKDMKEAIHRHMQDMFNAYFGGAKLGVATQQVYKMSIARHLLGNPLSVHESCLWAGKLEMEIVKGIKSNNQLMLKMTHSCKDIFLGLRNDREAFLPSIDLDTIPNATQVWDLYTKKTSPNADVDMDKICEGAASIHGDITDVPLVYITNTYGEAHGNFVQINEQHTVTLARICQHIRNRVLDLFNDVDTEASLAIKNGIVKYYNQYFNLSNNQLFVKAELQKQVTVCTNAAINERYNRIIEIMSECNLDECNGDQLLTQHLVNRLYDSKGVHGEELRNYKMQTAMDIQFICSPDGVAYTTGLLTMYDLDAKRFAIQCINFRLRKTLEGKNVNQDTMIHAAMRVGADVFQKDKSHQLFYMCFSINNIERALNIWHNGVESYLNAPIEMEVDEELVHMAYDESEPEIPEMSAEDLDELMSYYN